MKKSLEDDLRTAQRRMLRQIVMTRRKTSTLEKDNEYDDVYDTEAEDDGVNGNSSDTTTEEQLEDYIDWIKRSTETAEGHARRCK